MKKQSYFPKIAYGFLAVMLLLLSTACNKKVPEKVDPKFSKYIAAFTEGAIYSSSSIEIELSQDMPAVQLNKEIEQNLFKFSPNIKGKAYWISNRRIKFVPESGQLKHGQKYDAWFSLGKVVKVSEEFKDFYFSFNTREQNFSVDVLPYSPIKDNDLVWNTVEGELNLADVSPLEDIQKMLTVSGGTITPKVKVVPTEVQGKYKFYIDSLKRESRALEYTLNVDGNSIGVDKKENITLKFPPLKLKNLEVIDTRLNYNPTECVRITFSDPLSVDQNIQGLISLDSISNYSYDIQKNVLRIYFEGDNSLSSVRVSLNKGLKSSDNKILKNSGTYALYRINNMPEIKLLGNRSILPDAKNLVIPFQAINLWAVDVTIIKIFENNILTYLQSNDLGGDQELRRFGRLVLKKRIRLDKDRSVSLNRWNNFSIDLSSLVEKDPGAIYRVKFSMRQEYSLYPCGGKLPVIPQEAEMENFDNTITDTEYRVWDIPETYYYESQDWSRYRWSEREDPCKESYYIDRNNEQATIVLASNIGITAKMASDQKVTVALTDIVTTKPISGAAIEVYNFQMQRIGQGTTDKDGFATVEYDKKGGVPFTVVAKNGKDKGYLKLTYNLSLSLSNFDVSGKTIEKGLKGYIYGERGVWRPGDSIFLTFILEDKNKTLPPNHPVSLEFFNPNGQLYERFVKTEGTNGFYPFVLKTDANAPTGSWRVVIKLGGVSFSKSISVETIKPNRLKVRLDLPTVIDASSGTFNGDISAQWLHGGTASNLKAKVEMVVSKLRNPFKGYESYSFNNPANKFYSDSYILFDSKLDGEGKALFESKLPPAANAPGMLQAIFISRVFESGGDASIYSQSAAYSPFSVYVGVKSPAQSNYDVLETDKNHKLEIVALSKDGKPVNANNLNIKIYKIKWSWWWNSNESNLSSYINSTSANVVLDENISTKGGKTAVDFKVEYPDWGRYLIIVKDKDGGHIAGRTLYVDWPSWRGRSDKPDAMGLTMLSFSTDKQTYNVGDKATIIIPKSSAGRALISIENGSKIISKGWVKTSAEEDAKYMFEVTDAMAPNFYVFANLLQPHGQEDNNLPIRLYGVLNINVENKNTILKPVISMSDVLRPEKEFTISVSEKEKKEMAYTVAIVDEGLLDLTSFKTPNAWKDFYTRQALGVRTWDMFDMVVNAQAGKMGSLLSIGGGDDGVNPGNSQVNRFKPVVKYLGPFVLKKGETQSHKITLPPYVGSVRAMVVAGSSTGAYGSAEKTVQVKNPLMILSTLPRVAGPEEEIMLPVNVFAMDKKVKNVSLSVKTSNGLLNLVDEKMKTVSFTKTGDKVVFFKLKANKKIGAERVTIKATGGGETSTEVIDIAVRNPNPAILLTADALVSEGDSCNLNIEMDNLNDENWVKLEVSRMPAINLNKNMAFLHDYPYGCSEQVTSKAFPLLYVEAFREFSVGEKKKMRDNINEAIRILTSRQLSDGGFIYWEGNSYPTEWVTNYVGHFLLEAKVKGYDVSESVLNKWKNFQKKTAQRWNNDNLYYSYYNYQMNDLKQAYRLYTLALANAPELGAMNRLKEKNDLSAQARWRLAATYILAGKKQAAKELTNNIPVLIDKYSSFNDTYGSVGRDAAMIMETNLLMGNVGKALEIAPKVAEELGSPYISTQSASFGLIAMAKLSEKMGKGLIDFNWSFNGVSQNKSKGKVLFQEFDLKPQLSNSIHLTNKGEGKLYVRLTGRTKPLEDKSAPKNEGINIYVKYVDATDTELDVKSLKQGTEFYAVVVVQNISGDYLTDLALTQIFPSGWEIFNNRLFKTASNSVAYQDIRDDRVLSFFNLRNGYSTAIKVRLQAAYCGRFYLPAVQCEAMYQPQTMARNEGLWVEVNP